MKSIQDFIIVDSLLTELLAAIAVGHAELISKSQTSLGTLAVKSAEVNVSFDLSAEARESKSGFSLGVRPTLPLGAAVDTTQTGQEFTQHVSNRATVTLHIVNVAPLIPETIPDNQPKPPPPEPEPTIPNQAIAILERFLRDQHIYFSPGLIAKFNQAQAELKAGNVAQARRLFAAVLAEINAAVKALPFPVDSTVQDALNQLLAWVGSTSAKPAGLSARSKQNLSALTDTLGELNMEPNPRLAFVAGVQAALQAQTQAEAYARLANAIITAQPHMAGRLQPVKFFDLLAKLDALPALRSTDPAWRERLAKPMSALLGLIQSLNVPDRTKALFAQQCQAAAASGSELEAGSRLFQAVQDFKQRTRGAKLPEDVRRALDGFQAQS
jgi:hypothetical protein